MGPLQCGQFEVGVWVLREGVPTLWNQHRTSASGETCVLCSELSPTRRDGQGRRRCWLVSIISTGASVQPLKLRTILNRLSLDVLGMTGRAIVAL